ncbi:hypothetical protein SAMN04515674_106106 [Pseudarcicella hirudinis]|uniref:Uncharacterized protein n=1 Tax=Pseudarcicella hirudinis TaxID=1079859 RepID=A0A1I5TLM4_9BACT|nr:hypothetical protein SAMN04515674_106106 [Pseudarcicella hirudinis]
MSSYIQERLLFPEKTGQKKICRLKGFGISPEKTNNRNTVNHQSKSTWGMLRDIFVKINYHLSRKTNVCETIRWIIFRCFLTLYI